MMMSYTTYESCWKIAELGCSSGPNALMVVSDIVNIIGNTSLRLNRGSPEIQIYLNDLFGNDFNTIFKLLPAFYQSILQEKGDKVGACFIHATPGNFYGRLFPNNYVQIFHSSYSLHWLSQAPKVSTKIAKPLNKGDIHITSTSPPSVYQAYLQQFERDFKLFLKSRSEELTPGGIMVLTLIGREKPHEIKTPCVAISMVLNDMVREGLIEETKLDFFDLPVYFPTAEEVRQVIDVEGSFKLEILNIIKMGWDADLQEDFDDSFLDSATRGEFIAKSIRAVFEPLLSAEFGEDIMDELFSRFAKLVAEFTELETLKYTNLIVSMTKNP
ncbi:probable jasmonic acid carboxyl methyltransferase 2 [Gastrolobium bilobum]|uniref:probable jasmonic acid carboxyl methyltransferase 2 n=1 Tax=Gastrolobium bilobum TaxID=150636 RepID=UPI002AB20EB4|nr:probable jasmonic acid carboxyl methyltransferase 2 [Gastrolobium bilobum]